MDSAPEPVAVLDEDACWRLLTSNTLGRIAVSAAGEVDIFPVNYYADGSTLLFRTAPGTKLLELTVHDRVAFEIDGYTDESAWSVVVKGTAERLESGQAIDEAEMAPLHPWIPTLKYRFVRIHPTTVSGRAFQRMPEPERY